MKKYPKLPWRTADQPIAGHPRVYKSGITHDWYTTPSPAGSYRSIFKWGDQKEYKIPSEGMYNYLSRALDFQPSDLDKNKEYGVEKVQYERACALTEAEIADLLAFVDGDGSTDAYVKLQVAYGQTMLDLMRLRKGIVEKVPDLVLYPSTTAQIEKIVAYCNDKKIAIYVYGGGSSVTRGVEPMVDRCISLDLRKNFNKVIGFNAVDHTVTVQPGMYGTALETYLNNPDNFGGEAYTAGHFPQSFEYSCVGGWVVTRGAGQNSSYYGKIEDIVLCEEYVTPVGTFRTESAPRKATGPNIDQIMMGSEGAFGILTEVTLKVRRLSHKHRKFSYMFASWDEGMNALREVMQSEEGFPSVFRLSDAEETELAMYMYGIAGTPLESLLKMRGMELGKMCLMIGFTDGADGLQKNIIKNVRRVARKHNAMNLTSYVATKWEGGRFSDPYLRDNFQDFGVIIDTLECAMTWDKMDSVHDYVRKFVKSHPNTVCTCHISHCYENGANLYFIWMQKDEGIEKFREFHSGVLNAIQESGASISHHHGIGKLFAPYNVKTLGPVQMDIIRALKKHFDPNNIMNPGGTLGL